MKDEMSCCPENGTVRGREEDLMGKGYLSNLIFEKKRKEVYLTKQRSRYSRKQHGIVSWLSSLPAVILWMQNKIVVKDLLYWYYKQKN